MYRDQPTPSSFEACGRLGSAFLCFSGACAGVRDKSYIILRKDRKSIFFVVPQSRSRGRWREKYTRIYPPFFFTASTRRVVRHQDEVSPPTTTNRAKSIHPIFCLGGIPERVPKSQIALPDVACTHGWCLEPQ